MVLIIGELINSTRKEVQKALEIEDDEVIRNLARSQVDSGADALDVNAAESLEDEVEDIKWLLEVIQDEVRDVRLCIDSSSAKAMEAGLRNANRRPIINSITNEDNNQPIRDLAETYQADIIGLPMGEEGLPETTQDRLREARALLEKCESSDIDRSSLYMDVMAMSVGSSPDQCREALEAARLFTDELGIKTCAGVTNISHGLPNRSLLNRVFFALLLYAGLDAAILNPVDSDLKDVLHATEALLGEDSHCLEYLRHIRSQRGTSS